MNPSASVEMAMWERRTQKLRYKEPSFSSSLLDAIYRSIDETRGRSDQQEAGDSALHRRNNAAQVDEDIESLRRAIMIEKWMESYTNSTTTSTPRHFPSSSASSTDSSMFSSSETESSASKSSPKSSTFPPQKPKQAQTPPPVKVSQPETLPKPEGKFTRTKSRAQKIYGELKKAKEPISPGGKIASFLNSIFSPRNLKTNQGLDEWSAMRKSRSMKDTTKCSLASRSCLSKTASSRGSKSKRSVRFCPVSVIVDEGCQPRGEKSTHNDVYTISPPGPTVGSQFIKKNIDSIRLYEDKNLRRHEFRDHYQSEYYDLDEMSCGSSDLFELENIGRVGFGTYEEELPVYETTSLQMHQSVGGGLVM